MNEDIHVRYKRLCADLERAKRELEALRLAGDALFRECERIGADDYHLGDFDGFEKRTLNDACKLWRQALGEDNEKSG